MILLGLTGPMIRGLYRLLLEYLNAPSTLYDLFFWIHFINNLWNIRMIAVGAKDGVTKLFAIPYLEKFRRCTLAGHTDSIVASFFEKDSLHINTLSRLVLRRNYSAVESPAVKFFIPIYFLQKRHTVYVGMQFGII